jgi:hypothetical protein
MPALYYSNDFRRRRVTNLDHIIIELAQVDVKPGYYQSCITVGIEDPLGQLHPGFMLGDMSMDGELWAFNFTETRQ